MEENRNKRLLHNNIKERFDRLIALRMTNLYEKTVVAMKATATDCVILNAVKDLVDV